MLHGPDYDPVAPNFARLKTSRIMRGWGHHVIFQCLLTQIPTTMTSQLPLALLAVPPGNATMAENRPRRFVQLCSQSSVYSEMPTSLISMMLCLHMASRSEINFLLCVFRRIFPLYYRRLENKKTIMPKPMLQQTRTSQVG